MKIEVIKPFRYAYGGFDVKAYDKGVVDVPEECAKEAMAQGWAKLVGEPAREQDGRRRAADSGDKDK